MKRRQLTVPERHALKIAKATLRMPDAMRGVMGRPSTAQAQEIIYQLAGYRVDRYGDRLTKIRNPARKHSHRQSNRQYSSRRLTARRRLARMTTKLGMRTSKAQHAMTKKIRSERGFFPTRTHRFVKRKKHGRGRLVKIKRNPSSGIRIVHNRLLGGWYVVRGPHQTPIGGGGRFNSKAEAQAWLDGSESRLRKVTYVRAPYRSNPSRHVKRHQIHAMPELESLYAKTSAQKLAAHRRARRHQKSLMVDPDKHSPYFVQVKRGKKWITIARFPYQSSAFDYGRALKTRYPSKTIRVFW